jgi:sensor c-di-GMP phosphodiesterase-like protein
MDLRQAITDCALEVYYQPCISLGMTESPAAGRWCAGGIASAA